MCNVPHQLLQPSHSFNFFFFILLVKTKQKTEQKKKKEKKLTNKTWLANSDNPISESGDGQSCGGKESLLKEDLFDKASNTLSQGLFSWTRPQSQPQHLNHNFNLDQAMPKPKSHNSIPILHMRTKPKIKHQNKSSLPKLR